MKETKSKTYSTTVEVKTVKPKSGQWMFPIFMLEKYMPRTEIFKRPQFFNTQGSVCVGFDEKYELYRDGEHVGDYAIKSEAVKRANEILGYL